LRSTNGEWRVLREDVIERGERVAKVIVRRHHWGVKGENVGPLMESIIIDVRAKAGQRAVLYVDDLEVEGRVPSNEAYRAEVERRWAPVSATRDQKVTSWKAALREIEAKLSALKNLSPQAEGMRRDTMARMRDVKEVVAEAKARDSLRRRHLTEVESFLERMGNACVNIEAVSAAERQGRRTLVYVVPPISSVMILPHDRYVPGKPSRRISLAAARSEYEPASFVLSAMADIDSLTVAVSDLRSDRETIPATRVDVKAVKCWYQSGSAWVGNQQDRSRRLLIPELLLNDDTLVKVDEEKKENYLKLSFPDGPRYEWISDPTEVARSRSLPVDQFPVKDSPILLPVDIPTGKNKQFWLTVHVPMNAKPGTYTGTIALNTPRGTIGELTLTLDVLPFELRPPYYTSSMDYHGRLDRKGKGSIGSWLKSRQQFRRELENMFAHGLRNCQHYSIRKDMLGEVLEIRKEVGMDNRTLYLKNTIPIGNPTDPAALEAIKKNVQEIIQFTKAYGTKVVYFYGMDERRGDVLRSQRPAWAAVRDAGGKIFVAGYEENIDVMGNVQDMHVRAGPPNAEEVGKWHALGHKIFCYAHPQTAVENPVVYRRNFGLLLWKYDYDDASTNAYQHTFGATWNDFDHRTYRSHTTAYPTVDGVIDTIAWEGYREAVDDVRYVTTLWKAIEAASQSKDHTLAGRAAAAQDFLRRLKAGEEIETGDLGSIRRDIVAHILALTRTQVPDAAGGK